MKHVGCWLVFAIVAAAVLLALWGSCWILVGVRGLLFEIDPSFAVMRGAASFSAVGSGCEVALGSLSETAEIEELKDDPEQRVRRALLRAEQWTTDVRGPFTVESV